ncbi:DUF1294 domain-containing protein [Pseudalkalibacillus hwajinpoensis]|uniref:DUF1294 domain-containing protein n=1 Tax=Guptibacillus hwajinpoensis TaxID=208199 RepID=UPI001CD3BDFB|nr:DUF1294 domain-containing protein [Pseudalkalibacillus hwajinpoensis]
MNGLILFIIYLVLINSGSFILMGVDKRRAKKRARRISEKTLWFFIVIGGSIGGYFGMKRFRHKTKHSQFIYGIPAVIIVHILLISASVYLNK